MLKKILWGTGMILLAILLLGGGLYQFRFKPMLTLFDKDKKAENFRHMDEIFPSHSIAASTNPSILPVDDTWKPDDAASLEQKLETLATTGFLVIRNDTILYERYFGNAGPDSRFTSFSLSKSITSMLIGIAIDEGKISSVEDPVDEYLPTLKGSGYEGVSIRNVLQMASGIRFSEDYDDPDSDINQLMFAAYAYFEPLKEWIGHFGPDINPGTGFHYQSINTAVLGILLTEVYGKTLSELLEEKIWNPMGAEYAASWITDEHETEIAFGFLNASLRDYAKIGLVMLHNGTWNGQEIIPVSWVEACTSIRPEEPRPSKSEGSAYQFHWWIPEGEEGEFYASGYMGQIIYVNPTRNVVIVKTGLEETDHLGMIRDLARQVSPIRAAEPAQEEILSLR